MADCINLNENGVPEKGTGPLTAYYKGIIFQFSEAQAAITDADALLKPTWQDLAYQEANRNYILIADDATDSTDNEPITQELSEVNITLGSKQGAESFKVVADECTLRTLLSAFKTSTVVYGYFITKDNKIRGQKGETAGTLDPIRMRVTANHIKAKPDSVEMVDLSIVADEDYIENVHSARPTWSVESLIPTRNVELVDNGSTTATLIVDATFCGDCDASSLTPANFTVDEAGVTEAGTWAASGNTYTFTPTSAPLSAGTYTVDYTDPEVNAEPYIIKSIDIAVS